jgi:hypothetical protein
MRGGGDYYCRRCCMRGASLRVDLTVMRKPKITTKTLIVRGIKA